MTRLRSLHPEPNLSPGKYRHYKGKFYELVGIARHSETLESVAVDGKKVPRFEYIKKTP